LRPPESAKVEIRSTHRIHADSALSGLLREMRL
jgi:hypothetical protein